MTPMTAINQAPPISAPAPEQEPEQDTDGCQCPAEFLRPTQEDIDRDMQLLRDYEAEFGPMNPPISPPLNPSQIVIVHGSPVPQPSCKPEKASS